MDRVWIGCAGRCFNMISMGIHGDGFSTSAQTYRFKRPCQPPSALCSASAWWKASIACVGGVNRNCLVASRPRHWATKSRLRDRAQSSFSACSRAARGAMQYAKPGTPSMHCCKPSGQGARRGAEGRGGAVRQGIAGRRTEG